MLYTNIYQRLTAFAVGLFMTLLVSAQVTFNGNTVSSAKKAIVKDTLVTKFNYADSKGNTFPIIINKTNGRCYVWKVSSKTNKKYKMYLPKEMQIAIAEKLNINYKS